MESCGMTATRWPVMEDGLGGLWSTNSGWEVMVEGVNEVKFGSIFSLYNSLVALYRGLIGPG